MSILEKAVPGKLFYIATLGCKVNQYESDGIAGDLISGGWRQCSHSSDADVCIINTCAVTSRAAMQSRQEIRKIVRSNPHARIVVTGCHAETEPHEIAKIGHVDIITGHRDKFGIPSAIMGGYRPCILPSPALPGRDGIIFHSFPPSVTGSKTRAYLKIQDGCSSFCTYCIVPHARGPSRSMPEEEVLNHLVHLTSLGYREAVITGIHVGAYGLDFSKKITLTQLLQRIEQLNPIPRIRLSSIEPGELTRGIIDMAARKTILCDHFHIPLQSGDDNILQRMGRPYDSKLFHSLIMKIKKDVPSAAVGVDILVGFPGESDQAFENTCKLIEELPVTYLHVFPFSPRKGTPAFDFPDKVPSRTIKTRSALLRTLGLEKRREFENRALGNVLGAVIQEKRDEVTGRLTALTSNYLSVLVDGGDGLKGKIVSIIPEKRKKDNRLYGTVQNP
ncbi:MAG: tRNA (N(6)-L-threonylcarbamoyladenosine(37)-C(2))-methylthiotransferase MtaB [Desulfamplus sp.]|nr:tRNA (N(6)-L-threonylcarbamoyladenosine(37)-C(2))-methylthiotransferase MtaB [Desulfamplus sp.]